MPYICNITSHSNDDTDCTTIGENELKERERERRKKEK